MQANSAQCTVSKNWINKRCSVMRGDLSRVADGFRCRHCDRTIQKADDLMVDGDIWMCKKHLLSERHV